MTQEYWEKARVQAAIAIMQGFSTGLKEWSEGKTENGLAYTAVRFADALINELQKEK